MDGTRLWLQVDGGASPWLASSLTHLLTINEDANLPIQIPLSIYENLMFSCGRYLGRSNAHAEIGPDEDQETDQIANKTTVPAHSAFSYSTSSPDRKTYRSTPNSKQCSKQTDVSKRALNEPHVIHCAIAHWAQQLTPYRHGNDARFQRPRRTRK